MKTNLALAMSLGTADLGWPWMVVCGGASEPTLSRKTRRCSATAGSDVGARKSPGTVSGLPYTMSAGEALRSSLGVTRSPSITHGNPSTQRGDPANRAIIDAFIDRWKRSTSPLACGW